MAEVGGVTCASRGHADGEVTWNTTFYWTQEGTMLSLVLMHLRPPTQWVTGTAKAGAATSTLRGKAWQEATCGLRD